MHTVCSSSGARHDLRLLVTSDTTIGGPRQTLYQPTDFYGRLQHGGVRQSPGARENRRATARAQSSGLDQVVPKTGSVLSAAVHELLTVVAEGGALQADAGWRTKPPHPPAMFLESATQPEARNAGLTDHCKLVRLLSAPGLAAG